LWNLKPVPFFVLRVTESVAPDHSVVVNDNSLADLRALANCDA
jgi:hypothetical protein